MGHKGIVIAGSFLIVGIVAVSVVSFWMGGSSASPRSEEASVYSISGAQGMLGMQSGPYHKAVFEKATDIALMKKIVPLAPRKSLVAGARAQASRSVQPAQSAQSPTQSKKIAVILFNFQDNATEPYSRAQIDGLMKTGTQNVDDYLGEASLGKWAVQTDIYGYYTIPFSGASCSPFWSDDLPAAATQAMADGYVASNYMSTLFVFPNIIPCPFVAAASGTQAYFNGNAFDLWTVIHELGHTFGLGHADVGSGCTQANAQGAEIKTTGCTLRDAGDPFEPMGGSGGHHYNATYKKQIGMLDPSEVLNVTQSGTYTVSANAIPGGSTYLLTIPVERNSAGAVINSYQVELRRPYGYDNLSTTPLAPNGVLIRRQGTGGVTALLDMTPGSNSSYQSLADAELAVGKSFRDVAADLTIKTLGVDAVANAADVQVTFGPGYSLCERHNPTVGFTLSSATAHPGDTLTGTLSVTNNDSSNCQPTQFGTRLFVPSGWTQVPGSSIQNVTLAPGASQQIPVTVGVPGNVQAGQAFSISAQLFRADPFTTDAFWFSHDVGVTIVQSRRVPGPSIDIGKIPVLGGTRRTPGPAIPVEIKKLP